MKLTAMKKDEEKAEQYHKSGCRHIQTDTKRCIEGWCAGASRWLKISIPSNKKSFPSLSLSVSFSVLSPFASRRPFLLRPLRQTLLLPPSSIPPVRVAFRRL